MDAGVAWSAIGALATLATAGVAIIAARLSYSSAKQSNESARESNAAAAVLANIELERRHSELTPRFRVRCEPWNPGDQRHLRLRVMLLGPPGLDRVDRLTVKIRDDHFRRGEGTQLAAGPTREEIKDQIWGPYRFTPGTGPDEARADPTGRITVYNDQLPVGEELPYQLERTTPPPWARHMSQEDWEQQRGPLIRLGIEAQHADYRPWTLPCEIDLSANHDVLYAGWVIEIPQ